MIVKEIFRIYSVDWIRSICRLECFINFRESYLQPSKRRTRWEI